MDIDKEAFEFLDALFKSHGFEIRLCGGAVRDMLLGQVPKDLDFCTNATPVDMLHMESDNVRILQTGIDHGTLTFMNLLGSFEVTTLRNDVETDGRHAKVVFTDSWKDDAARRDFTINAMMMDVDGNIYDWFDGQKDLKKGFVRFVGDADERIKEDALRMIRWMRFEARFGKSNKDRSSEHAIIRNADLIRKVSPERVWQEIKVAAKGENFWSFMMDMVAHFGIFTRFGIRMNLVGRAKFETLNNFIAKFPTFGVAVFLKNDEVKMFCDAFKLSIKERQEVEFFSSMKGVNLYKEFVENLIVEGVDRDWLSAVAVFQEKHSIARILMDFVAPKFPVTGKDLIAAGIKQGPNMGQLLFDMRRDWFESRFTLTKKQLMEKINGQN